MVDKVAPEGMVVDVDVAAVEVLDGKFARAAETYNHQEYNFADLLVDCYSHNVYYDVNRLVFVAVAVAEVPVGAEGSKQLIVVVSVEGSGKFDQIGTRMMKLFVKNTRLVQELN